MNSIVVCQHGPFTPSLLQPFNLVPTNCVGLPPLSSPLASITGDSGSCSPGYSGRCDAGEDYQILLCSVEICMCCGGLEIHTQHPLFHGGMCEPYTSVMMTAVIFLCDDDGFQADCSVRCWGKSLLMCDNPRCHRRFCEESVNTLVYPGCSEEIKETDPWICFLCVPWDVYGLLKRRTTWRAELKCFYDQDITKFKGLLILHTCFLWDVFHRIEEWEPYDFIFGSTPPVAKSYKHPSAWYFYQYFRLLQYGKPAERFLDKEARDTASRFFQVSGKRMFFRTDRENDVQYLHTSLNIDFQ
uniref:PHD-type domain-containing protein n=1 Tax=Varanus komodoensis TaxID=61221 RepID=A0A8D2LE04_VARKO